MAYTFQISIDCAAPHPLAAWWAETLGWSVEPSNEEFIQQMIDQGFATKAETEIFNDVLVWKEGAAIVNGSDPSAPRVLFQAVPEQKHVKNRLHLDVKVPDLSLEQAKEGLIARGATFLHNGVQGPHTWITMADPEGNEFCVTN